MTNVVPTVPVTAAVSQSAPLTPFVISGLARELAMAMRDLPDILSMFKVSKADYEKLKTNELFQKLVDAARIEWQAATNTITRTQIEAAWMLEQAMPHLYGRILNPAEPLNHVTEAFKCLSDIGGLKKTPGQGSAAERFQITINLGADTKIEFDGTKQPYCADPTVPALPLSPVDDREERV